MHLRHSKTKNLKIYTYLLNHETSEKAYENVDVLANHLKVHKNKIISCIAQAKKNPLIYKELVARGYADHQIPLWFLRPEKEEEEPQTQNSETIESKSPQNQELTIARTQSYENTEPQFFMGVRIYEWGELQNLAPPSQPKTTYDTIFERKLRELQGLATREREATRINDWKHELSQARDPANFLRIALTNKEWSNYYYSLSTREKNKLFDSLFPLFHYKNQIELAQENQRQFNEFFPLWLYGQTMGNW